MNDISKKISKILLSIMNIMLLILGLFLAFSLILETYNIIKIVLGFSKNYTSYKDLIEEIIIFFLYFEFLALITKYFKNNFHFPLRYFIYIGITAIVRLIIIEHESSTNVLFWSGAILILVISLAIVDKFLEKD